METAGQVQPWVLRAHLSAIAAAARHAADPREASAQLCDALSEALAIIDAQRIALEGAEASMVALQDYVDTLESTLAQHAHKLAAHDAYDARIAALEAV